MFDGRWRTSFERGLQPVGRTSAAPASPPITSPPSGCSLPSAPSIAIGAGALRGGLLLVILAAVPDLLDGAVAKASGTAIAPGRVLRLGRRPCHRHAAARRRRLVPRDRPTAVTRRCCRSPSSALSTLISYERAKAESLGFDARGGLMERAERIILLCFGLLFDSLLVPILWVMLVLTTVTAVQRFVKVWRQASAERPGPRAVALAVPPGRASHRQGAEAGRAPSQRQALIHRCLTDRPSSPPTGPAPSSRSAARARSSRPASRLAGIGLRPGDARQASTSSPVTCAGCTDPSR